MIDTKDVIKLHQISDTESPWKCIRLEISEVQVVIFKTIMRDVVKSTGSISISTSQPKDVSLYKIEQPEHLLAVNAERMCHCLSQIIDMQ